MLVGIPPIGVLDKVADRGTTGQRDPLDSDTEIGESSSKAKLDDGESSAESKGIVVTLAPRWT